MPLKCIMTSDVITVHRAAHPVSALSKVTEIARGKTLEVSRVAV